MANKYGSYPNLVLLDFSRHPHTHCVDVCVCVRACARAIFSLLFNSFTTDHCSGVCGENEQTDGLQEALSGSNLIEHSSTRLSLGPSPKVPDNERIII